MAIIDAIRQVCFTTMVYFYLKGGKLEKVTGQITEVKDFRLMSNNSLGALIKLKCAEDVFDILVFPKIYNKHRELIKEEIVINVDGHRFNTHDEEHKTNGNVLIANDIYI